MNKLNNMASEGDICEYSNIFFPDTWSTQAFIQQPRNEENIDVDLILTNQSTIEDIAEQDVVKKGVHGLEIVQGTTEAAKVSKRGEEVQKKVMQDCVQVVPKKKCRTSKKK
ncbi:hypothetical protein RND71_042462 [Anisodus tanguticus]|uniref:Uncharacterized protein n=1 Tax=Anisodus tanguticus TaxID=243964 RepID=A0AAE1UUN8_9SOLA|nr:hypothetical protein RND71_042462 [Anisodus tanguticus]